VSTATLPTRADVEAACARIGRDVRRTPVVDVGGEELRVDARVTLKLELLQHTGSFKARGALSSVRSLPPGTTRVTAASGGNHGAAVAWAAARSGMTADVFAPATSTPAKLERIEEYGAVLHRVDGHVGDALDECGAFSRSHGVPLIHPYDTVETVSGAGTLGLEVAEQVPGSDVVLLACGGGGLFSGVAAALRGVTAVQPVEPELCPHLHVALEAGRPVEHPAGGVAADSLGPGSIGRLAFDTARDAAVAPVLVSEEAIVDARRWLWDRLRILAEPGACVPVAALMSGRYRPRAGSSVTVVVSGGNNPTLP
jgi:threonine dehydratase